MKNVNGRNAQALLTTFVALSLMLAVGTTACGDDEDASTNAKTLGPQIELSGSTDIALEAHVGESTTSSFGFSNAGDLPLSFEIVLDSTWLAASPLEGLIEPATQQEVALTATCPAQSGAHSVVVGLRSNDKSNEVHHIVVALTCTMPLEQGSLEVTITGLSGLDASISIEGPEGYSHMVTATTILNGLVPGQYQLLASDVTDGPLRYVVTPQERILIVVRDETTQAEFIYEGVPGSLQVSISGLPDGLEGAGTIVAPDGTEQAFENGSTFDALLPATYTLIPELVVDLPAAYSAPQAEVTVNSGEVAPIEIGYQLVPAAVNVTITGLPDGLEGAVTVAGPEGYEANLTQSTMIEGLAPGDYIVTPGAVDDGSARYRASTVNVEAQSQETVEVEVDYELVLGALAVTIAGLPEGLDADVMVSNEDGFSHALTATDSLVDLVPGDYRITVAEVTEAPAIYTAQGFDVTVSSDSSQTATVAYEVILGSLDVAITGLPIELDAAVVVSNEDGFSHALASSETLLDLVPGTYTLSATAVLSGATLFRAPGATAIVTSSETTIAAVTYFEFERPTEITNEDDGGPGSLRDTIAYALWGSTLTFAPSVGNIVLTNGEILIAKPLTIEGPGADELTISGNDTSRIFNIAADVAVTINGVTLTQGAAVDGGAIESRGQTVLDECAFLANTASNRGGAVYQPAGTLSITNCDWV